MQGIPQRMVLLWLLRPSSHCGGGMDLAVPAASGRANRSYIAAALVAVSLLGDSYLYAVLPVHYAEAGISLVTVGLMLSINRWVRFFTNPLAGVVGARVGWRWPFAAALWLGAATTAGYGLVQGAVALAGLRGLWGLAWSFLRLGGMAAVLAGSPVGRRGRLMGLFVGVARLGSVVGVVAGGYLADRLGYSSTAVILGAATALGAAVGLLPQAGVAGPGGPAGPAGAAAGAAGAAAGALAGESEPASGKATAPAIYRNRLPATRQEWAVSLSAAALHAVTSGIVTGTIGLLIKERLGAQVAAGPWLVGAATVAGAILGSRFLIDLLAGPAVGHWADRRGRGPMLGLATSAMVMALVVLGWGQSLGLIIASVLTVFAASTGAAAILDAWAGDLAGQTPGRFLPAYNTWLDLGAAAGPLLGYWLISLFGLGPAYAGGAVLLLVAWAARLRLVAPA